MMRRLAALALGIMGILVLAGDPLLAARQYSADRFDVVARIEPEGFIHVVETVVFRFEGGPFTRVFRDIPTRRTDGIRVLEASMDGRPMPFGDTAGHVEVDSTRSRLRVRWRFAPIADSTHTFTISYAVVGLAQRAEGADLVDWLALPTSHDYRIASSTIRIEYPPAAAPIGEPEIASRNAGQPVVRTSPSAMEIAASGIRRNGWIRATCGSGLVSRRRNHRCGSRRAIVPASWAPAGSPPRWHSACSGCSRCSPSDCSIRAPRTRIGPRAFSLPPTRRRPPWPPRWLRAAR
jgi:hypothetical protein